MFKASAWVWVGVAGLVSIGASPALAYEDQATVGGSLGYAGAVDDELPANGITLGAAGSYGLNDVWSLRGQLAYSGHPDENEALNVLLLGGEAIYILDVLEIVPFVGGGVDFIYSENDWRAGIDVGAHAVFGVDYLLSRTLLLGLDFRTFAVPFPVSGASLDPVYMNLGARIEYILDL